MKTHGRFCAAFVLCAAESLADAQPIKLKFAVFSPDTERLFNTVKKPFAEAVNEASGGTVQIELFPNGALGRAPQQQAQMVLDGVADIGFIVPPFTPGRFPDTEVMELPGLFRDLAEATHVYTRLFQAGVLHDYGDYVPIAMWGTPPFSLHSNFPITSIKDLKGKKVRGSGVIQVESLKTLGAVPVGMPPTEVPEALARKTIDASTSQPAVLFDFGLDRVTSHHYFMRLGVVPLAVVMNRKSFDALPKAGTGRDPHPQPRLDQQALSRFHAGVRQVPHRSPEGGPEAHRRVPGRGGRAGRADGVRAGDQGLGQEEPAQRRDLPSGAGGNREIPFGQIAARCSQTLERTALVATRALSVVGLTALMSLAVMTIADGLMRWIANRPIEGVRDLGGLAIALAIACCLPVVMIEKGNITIRLAGNGQPDASAAFSRSLPRRWSAGCSRR